jgi:hypothetical protein
MSNRSAALVGAAGMKERKRGLSQETMAVASSVSKTSMIRRGSVPPGVMRPARLASSDEVRAPPKSRGTGSTANLQRQ